MNGFYLTIIIILLTIACWSLYIFVLRSIFPHKKNFKSIELNETKEQFLERLEKLIYKVNIDLINKDHYKFTYNFANIETEMKYPFIGEITGDNLRLYFQYIIPIKLSSENARLGARSSLGNDFTNVYKSNIEILFQYISSLTDIKISPRINPIIFYSVIYNYEYSFKISKQDGNLVLESIKRDRHVRSHLYGRYTSEGLRDKSFLLILTFFNPLIAVMLNGYFLFNEFANFSKFDSLICFQIFVLLMSIFLYRYSFKLNRDINESKKILDSIFIRLISQFK